MQAMQRAFEAGGAPTSGPTATTTLSREEDELLPPLCAAVVQFQNIPAGTPAHAQGLQMLRQLVAKGANFNQADPMGFTALHHAAMIGDAELLRVLLAAPGVPGLRGGTASAPACAAACSIVPAAAALCSAGARRDCLRPCLPPPSLPPPLQASRWTNGRTWG